MRRRRPPTRTGEILQEEFLLPPGMTRNRAAPARVRLRVRKQIAGHVGCDVKVINRIVNGRTSLTAEMAHKLAAAFRTTPEFWLNAQKALDPCEASARIGKLPRPLRKVPSFTSVSPRTR